MRMYVCAQGRDRCLEEARLATFTVEECRLCKRTEEHTQTYVPTSYKLPSLRHAETQAYNSCALLLTSSSCVCVCVHTSVFVCACTCVYMSTPDSFTSCPRPNTRAPHLDRCWSRAAALIGGRSIGEDLFFHHHSARVSPCF